MMKFWLLRPVVGWDPWYDKTFGFVVAAETERIARAITSDECYGVEGKDVWLDSDKTFCTELKSFDYTIPTVIMEDFAGA